MHHHILAGELGMRPRVPRGEPRKCETNASGFMHANGYPLIAPGAFPFGTWGKQVFNCGHQTIWGTEQYDYSSVLARPVHSSTYIDVDVSRWLIGRPFVNEYGSMEITLRTISMQFWMRLRSWLRRTRSRMAGLSPGPGETQRGTLLRLGRPGVNLVWSKERNGLISSAANQSQRAKAGFPFSSAVPGNHSSL